MVSPSMSSVWAVMAGECSRSPAMSAAYRVSADAPLSCGVVSVGAGDAWACAESTAGGGRVAWGLGEGGDAHRRAGVGERVRV